MMVITEWKRPVCCVCNKYADIMCADDKWYCFRHIPKKREIIGRYSGRSMTPYGRYEDR